MFMRGQPDFLCRPVVEALEQRVLYHGGVTNVADLANVTAADISATVGATAASAPSSTPASPWAVEAVAPVQLFEAEGASVNGKLYVFGGFDNYKIQVTSSAEVYDPATNTWHGLGNTPAPQTHVGTATDGRVIYFAGGFRGNWYGQASTDFWAYDTVTGTWTRGPSLPQPRGAGGLVLLGRQLHFFGGAYGPDPDHVSDAGDHWVLDLDNPSAGWVAKAPLPDPRNHLGYTALGGKVYAIGGQHQLNESHGLDTTVGVYDPATDSWSSAAPLPAPRSHVHNSTFVYDGRIICVGGTDTGDVASDQILAYDPAANAWSVIGSLPDARSAAVARAVGNELIVATGTPTGVLPQTNTWERPLDFVASPAGATSAPTSAPAPTPSATPTPTPAPTPTAAPAGPAPGAPATAGDLTVSVTTPNPATVVSAGKGAKGVKASADVQIDNAGKGRSAGPVTVDLYLSPSPTADPAADASAVRVASESRRLSLQAGRGKTLHTAFRYPADLAPGTYFLVAQMTAGAAPAGPTKDSPAPTAGASAGATAVTVSPVAVTVSAPIASVTAAFAAPLPAKLRPGGRVTASLVLKNQGNTSSDGPIRIALSVIGDAPAVATPFMTLTRRTVIAPGRSKRVKVRLVLPKGMAAGSYSLAATATPAATAGQVSAAVTAAGAPAVVSTAPFTVA